MDWLQTVLLATVLLLLYTWIWGRTPKGFPPGPLGLPLLGYFPFLGKIPYVTMMKLGKKYGSVFTLPLFNTNAIVLNDWKAVKEALIDQNEVFSGRPPTALAKLIMNQADIVFSDGAGWKERRRFTLHHLRDFGFGKKSMEGLVMEEVEKLMERLRLCENQKIDISNLFFFSIMNIIWKLVGDKHFDHKDKKMAEYAEHMDTVFQQFSNDGAINFIPWVRHLPGMGYAKFMNANDKTNEFLFKEIDDHIATYQDGNARDFIDIYLSEMKKQQAQMSPASARSFQRVNLEAVLRNLFNAGIDTISSTLTWGVLYMITWPEIQRKVQQEMDSVIGRARLPTFQDRNMLPYTEAVLLEIHRFASIVPLSIFHYTKAPTKLMGYDIPKSTLVFQNIWGVHHDPESWGDPEVFRPERFLDAQGKVQKPEYLIPFSVGSRACLGEPLARMEVYLFFTCLMHQFTFARVTGEKPPSLDAEIRITIKPVPFSLIVKQR